MTTAPTPREIVLGIVTLHGPLSVVEVHERCAQLGYTNPRSTAATLFHPKAAGRTT